jgi:hypothetical protein
MVSMRKGKDLESFWNLFGGIPNLAPVKGTAG